MAEQPGKNSSNSLLRVTTTSLIALKTYQIDLNFLVFVKMFVFWYVKLF